jgi:hypothetical protein
VELRLKRHELLLLELALVAAARALLLQLPFEALHFLC